jgi:hypothetical protein
MTRRFHLITALCIALVIALAPHGRSFAAGTVDYASLNPSPADLFDSSELATLRCISTGSGVICRGSEVYPFDNTQLGSCGTSPLVANGNVTFNDTLRYDSSGNLVELSSRVDRDLTLTSAGTGRTARYMGSQTISVTPSTPGDLDTAIVTKTGLTSAVIVPGQGIVYQSSGNVTFGADGSLSFHGHHDEFQGVDLVSEVCSALAA